MIPLGILAAQAPPALVPAFELISTQVLGATATTVTFSSLGGFAATYKHLQLRLSVRSGSTQVSQVRFNDLSTSIYDRSTLAVFAGDPTIFVGKSTNRSSFEAFTASSTSNVFTPAVIDIFDWASATKNKTFRTESGDEDNIRYISGLMRTTAAITSISLTASNNWQIGSRFSLYGIKGD
jgi:hypothetical protein